jgi:uncharacterized membrane protein HdeD (DUF308 family)
MEDIIRAGKALRDKKPLRLWALFIAEAVVFAGGVFLAFIARADLYANLAPFFGVLLIAGGIIPAAHALFNVRRLPAWGFVLFPALLILAAGVMLLIYPDLSAEVVSFYTGYGLIGGALVVVSYALCIKEKMNKLWVCLLAAGILGFVPPVLLILQPVTGWLTPLMWTRVAFIWLTVSQALLAFFLGVVAVGEKKDKRKKKESK